MKHKRQPTIATQEAIQVLRSLAPFILVLCLIILVLVKK